MHLGLDGSESIRLLIDLLTSRSEERKKLHTPIIFVHRVSQVM